jgi:hypothetical protein
VSNPFAVGTSYIASIRAIREILEIISTTSGDRWWIESETGNDVTIAYAPAAGASELDHIMFKFPKIHHLPLPDGAGELVCLYPVTREPVQAGLYMERGELLGDDCRDWEQFWPAFKNGIEEMRRGLITKYLLDGSI